MPRTPLYNRLPDIWRRLDALLGYPLQRYLDVLDTSFDGAHDKTTELLDLRSIERIPDKWVDLPGPLVGHRWKPEKGRAWNRRRTQHAVPRASYKGTMECLGDLVREHGGSWHEVVDMASRLWVWNRQGLLSRGDSHLMAADYWHHGAYLLRVLDDLDLDAFLEDFQDIRQGGTVWYFEVLAATPATVCEAAWGYVHELEALDNTVPCGRFNRDLWLTFDGALRPAVLSEPALRTESSSRCYGRFNRDLFLTFEGTLPASRETEITAPLGYAGGSITVDSVIRVDRADITVDQGVPGNPMSAEATLIQEGAQIVEEEVL